LTDGLRELGYGDGELHLEVRSAQNSAELLGLAAELLALKVEVMFAFQTPAAVAAKQAVREVPVVFLAADPVGSGLVESLAHPGGNMTGVSAAISELGAKNLELIRELLPPAQRVAVLGNSDDPFHQTFLDQILAAAKPLKIEIRAVMLQSAIRLGSDVTDLFEKWHAEAVLVQPSIAMQPIAELALKFRIPAVSPNPSFVTVGGLISYSADYGMVPRRCAALVAEILKGSKPENRPVELPTKFWLALNLKTARQLDLEVSQTMLARADQLIE
jgi:putative ABC transport system substrate-binding protein